ncbi:hypothetical protein HJC23_012579 [Cyclotella cryptica]|uniref:Uncharacterized protein n=1 Tax=Cyclotella cryptica TaxID=29204 RepID=A0ABD3NYS0_9STRA
MRRQVCLEKLRASSTLENNTRATERYSSNVSPGRIFGDELDRYNTLHTDDFFSLQDFGRIINRNSPSNLVAESFLCNKRLVRSSKVHLEENDTIHTSIHPSLTDNTVPRSSAQLTDNRQQCKTIVAFSNRLVDGKISLRAIVVDCNRQAILTLSFTITIIRVSFRKKKSTKNLDTVPGKEGDAATPSPAAGDSKPTEESREPELFVYSHFSGREGWQVTCDPHRLQSAALRMIRADSLFRIVDMPWMFCEAAKPAPAPSKPPQMEDIPDLLETMMNEKGEKSAAATKRIYELCDVGHKQNRVPMVCSGKYDVLTPLAQCLTQESGDGRHLACLALNNLSIPTENKRVMALGPSSSAVIGGLCKVIAEDKQESYLCCICLMNLSFLEASITTMLQHSPVPEGKDPTPPLDNPDSLLRILEKLLKNAPAVPKSGSGKSEGVRWACGLIKNLAKSEENAALFGKTDIPKCVVDNIRNTTAPPSRWTSNSLEDFSLFVILNLAQWPVSRDALIKAGAIDVIKPIMAEGDLQGLKATMACAFLGASWSDFPESGSTAAKSVSELMTNIIEKKGKDGQYAYGVFKLYTSTKAYRDLSAAARAADGESGESNTKVLAVPSAVALCLQVVSDLVLAADDEANGGSKYVPDVKSAEYCAAAILNMLPAILQAGDPPRKSIQSEKACGEISTMLTQYAQLSGTSAEGKECALKAAEEIKAASGSARPILEISHDLWTQYRKREGQPLDQFISQEKGIEVDESGPLTSFHA